MPLTVLSLLRLNRARENSNFITRAEHLLTLAQSYEVELKR
jgi:hypothetical protein